MKTGSRLRRSMMAMSAAAGMAGVLAMAGMATVVHAATPATEDSVIPVYAPVKERGCTDCKTNVPEEMIPRRGVVLSNGSFATPAGYWEMVDIDQRKMTRFITQINATTHKLAVVQSRTVPLSDSDVAQVVELSNAIWRLPQTLPGAPATDVVWGVDLFDGASRRKENGVGEVQGDGARLKAALEQIWQRLAR